MKNVKVSEMGNELMNILMNYSEDVANATKKAVDEVANGVMNEVKSHTTWNDKAYTSYYELKTIYDNERGKYIIWHVKNPYYRLTHLLELGHLTRDGRSYSKKYPHVIYGQKYAENNLERVVKEKIEQCKT